MIGAEAGKSYAYLLGVYLGDGCVTTQGGKKVFKLNTIDEDFALATQAAIKDMGGASKIYKHAVSKSSKPNHSLWCGHSGLCEKLESDTERKSKLPSLSGDSQIRELIVGLMDSEGFVAKKTGIDTGRAYYMGFKSCDVWVPDFIRLMQGAGLKIGTIQKEKPYKPGYKEPTRFHIKMQSWVDSGLRFNIKRKQERVDLWASTEPYTQRSLFPRKLTSETNTPEALRG